jgi:uncharacterized protein (TIGR02246 family)
MLTCLRLLMITLPLVSSAASPTVGAKDTSAILHARDEWVKALHGKQLDAFTMLYTPDAMFLTPDGNRSNGRDAIRELTRKAMESFTSNITLLSMAEELSGDLAYDSGDYRETLVMADGKSVESHGTYLTIYRRQHDGKWLITQQVWTGAMPETRLH